MLIAVDVTMLFNKATCLHQCPGPVSPILAYKARSIDVMIQICVLSESNEAPDILRYY